MVNGVPSFIPKSTTEINYEPLKFPDQTEGATNRPMASIYRCGGCGTDLNLSSDRRYPAGTYFEAGEKGTTSFSWVDESKLRFTKENKFRPFFETVDYWGLVRKRTRMECDACGFLVGYVYDDGLPFMEGTGQFGFGPSQAVPRAPRYRFIIKALTLG